MSGDHDHCRVCGDDMCDGKHDAQPRTCRECKHYYRVQYPRANVIVSKCVAPVPPWASAASVGDVMRMKDGSDDFAQECQLYEEYEP